MYRLMSGLLTCLALVGCNSGSDDKFANSRADGTQTCPANMTCSFMKAPKDYDDPNGEMVDIYYGVHKAHDPSNRIGALILNFGGPSAEAVQGAGTMAASHLPQDILNRFDIVGIDPRGAGQSAFAKELTDCAVSGDCTATYQQVAPYLGSNTIVRDIDRLRSHLGDDKLTFLGYSYGTRLGSLYAHTFPDKVRAIVLDSPMSPTDANNVDIRIGNTAGFEKIADFRLGHNITRNQRYQTIVDTLLAHKSYQASNDSRSLSLEEGVSTLDLTVARETSGDWQNIQSGLVDLLDYDKAATLKWQLLLTSSSSYDYRNSSQADDLRGNALFKAVVCTDERTPLSESEIDASLTRYMGASSLYGLVTYAQTAELCKGWSAQRDPIAAVTNMEVALGGQQILIIGGQYDPATPYKWAEEMATSFGSSASVVTINNYPDHGFSYSNIACIDQNTTAYLLEPDSKIADQTCDAPPSATTKSFSVEADAPHPAKDVIGW